jgi:hypothetical protein
MRQHHARNQCRGTIQLGSSLRLFGRYFDLVTRIRTMTDPVSFLTN